MASRTDNLSYPRGENHITRETMVLMTLEDQNIHGRNLLEKDYG